VLRPNGDVTMDGLMLFTMFVGIIAFTLMYVWLVIHRQRTFAVEDALDDQGLDLALAARRRETVPAASPSVAAPLLEEGV
jgi:heme exporter protein C